MSLDSVFCPKNIALIGASRDEKSVGHALLKNLLSHGFAGEIFPVNPKADEILGKKCFKKIDEIQQPIDLAIIAIPAPYVLDVAKEAIGAGAKALVVVSAGFKEAGAEGKDRETALVHLCNQSNVSLVGPNCLGVLNPHIQLNASFETVMPNAGTIAFVSQSGALVSSLLDIANTRGIGFSKIISVGNKAQMSEHELLPYLLSDPQTSVILLYAETLADAPALITLLRTNQHSSTPKPVVLLKAGSSLAGQKASSSHTGSLAGADASYDALAHQAGIVRVQTINELLTTGQVLANNPIMKGNRIAIITNAGGPGIIATDQSEDEGLTLATLDDATKERLKAILPPASHIANPIDVLGDASSERYSEALHAVGSDEHVDAVLTILTPQSMTDIPQTAQAIVDTKNKTEKIMVATFIGATSVDAGVDILIKNTVTHAQFPEEGVTAIAHAAEYGTYVTRNYPNAEGKTHTSETSKKIIEDLQNRQVSLVETESVLQILSAYDIPVVAHALVQSKEDAIIAGKRIGKKLALKIVSPDISHKTDVGGVLLDVAQENVDSAFLTLLANVKEHAPLAVTHGVLVTEMIEGDGMEIILGIKKEPGLGTMIMLGMGGIFVELLHDVVFRFAPLTRDDAKEMIDTLQSKLLIYGFRGKKKRDIEVLIHTVVALSDLVTNTPEIKELDINPFYLREEGQGGLVLDARIILEHKT